MKAGDIKVGLTLEGNSFRVEMKRAGVLVKELRRDFTKLGPSIRKVEKHTAGFGARMRHAITSISLARGALVNLNDIFLGLPRAVAKASGEIERMTKLMSGLAGSSQEVLSGLKTADEMAAVWTKGVFNMAKTAPFAVDALTDSFVKLKVAGLDPTDGSMQALVDSVAKFGGTSEHLKRASIAIQQMGGKGVISMEELRQQLGEAVPDAIQLMARGVGLSVGALVKEISLGTVESASALRRMTTVMAIENRGAALRMMNTWTGQLAKLKTNFMLFYNEVGGSGDLAGEENGFFAVIKRELEAINAIFDGQESGRFARDLGRSMASATEAVAAGVKALISFGTEIRVVTTLVAAFYAGILAGKVLPWLLASVVSVNKALIVMQAAVTGSTARMAGLSAATGAAATRTLTLKTAMTAMGGAVTIITTLLALGVTAWWNWGKAARDAVKSADDAIRESQATSADTLIKKAQLLEQDNLIAHQKEMRRLVISSAGDATKMDEKIADAVAKRAQILSDINKAKAQALINDNKKAIREQNQAVDNQINHIVEDTAKIRAANKSAELSELAAVMKAGGDQNAVRKRFQEIYQKIEIKSAADQLAVQEANVTAMESALAKATDKQKRAAEDSLENAEFLRNKAIIFYDNVKNLGSLDKISGSDGVDKVAEKKFKKFTSLAARLRQSIAAINTEITGTSKDGQIANFLQQIEEAKLSPNLSATLKDLLKVYRSGAEGRDIAKSIDKVTQRIETLKQTLGKGSSAAAKLKLELDRLGKTNVPGNDPEEAELRRLAAEAIRLEDEIAVRAVTESARKKTAAVNQSMASQQDAIKLRYQEELRQIDDAYSRVNVSESGKAAVILAKQEEMVAAKRQFEFNMRSPAQKTADQWARATDNMKEASKGWMDDFISKSVEAAKTGKFEFGGMVESILEDILRITMQKQFGGIAQQAADGLADFMGGILGNSTDKETEAATKVVDEFGGTVLKAGGSLLTMSANVSKNTQGIVEQTVKGVTSATSMATLATSAGAASVALNALAQAAYASSASAGSSVAGGLFGGLFGDVIGSFAGSLGGGSGNALNAGSSSLVSDFNLGSTSFFAKGGIMSQLGSMSLKKYAGGGVANSPQLAMFGEGSMNEAYVPLPDGRSIPVSLSGGRGGGTVVNVINNTNATARTEESKNADGSMSIDVIIEQVEGNISRNVSRGRGTLSKSLEKTYALNRAAGAY
jgi:tape measure domain-containing protein